MKTRIAGYDYFSNKVEAVETVKNKDEVVAFETGLGWYVYNKREYEKNPRKRMFGF